MDNDRQGKARWHKNHLPLAEAEGDYFDAVCVQEKRTERSHQRSAQDTKSNCREGAAMKKETFDELLTSIEQGGTILRGKKAPSRSFRIQNPNVSAIRRHLGLTQQKFAELLGISPATLRNWEQGRRKPEGAARVLLCVAAKYPKAVLDTVHS
jgi:putative transcriptional regulator